MRRVLLAVIAVLTVSGVVLVLAGGAGEGEAGWRKAVSLTHIWGGLFFLVIFPMYAWDHVNGHREWLRVLSGVTVSGLTQLATGVLLALSGLVVLAYGEAVWASLRQLHHLLTYVLLAALVMHFLSPKSWS